MPLTKFQLIVHQLVNYLAVYSILWHLILGELDLDVISTAVRDIMEV